MTAETTSKTVLEFLFDLVSKGRLDFSQAQDMFARHQSALEGPFGDKLREVIMKTVSSASEMTGTVLVSHIDGLVSILTTIPSKPAAPVETPFEEFRRRMLETSGKSSVATGASLPALKGSAPSPVISKPTPAVPVDRSVFPEYIVCLEDGTEHKNLGRYLRSQYDLSPEEYRDRWGLPDDYPMTAGQTQATPAKAKVVATSQALKTETQPAEERGPGWHPFAGPRPKPAVPVSESVRMDRIVCLEDGTEHQMMKRYLKRKYKMTDKEYRERWGLPDDYPMNAPKYHHNRLELLSRITEERKAKNNAHT